MAWPTVMAEVAGHMVWIRRLGKLSLMTLVAIVEHKLVVAVYMARLTLRCTMRAGQRKVRRAVVERRRAPCTRGMTHRALVREIERLMVGICRTIEVRSMAVITC
jgi:hypothetical protein